MDRVNNSQDGINIIQQNENQYTAVLNDNNLHNIDHNIQPKITVTNQQTQSTKQKKVFSLIKKLSLQTYQQTHKLPSLTKMIQTISHIDPSTQQDNQNLHKNQRKSLLHSQYSSNKSTNSLNESINSSYNTLCIKNKSNRNKRLKNISKLIGLQQHNNNKVKSYSFNDHDESSQLKNQIHSNIHSLIDQIYSAQHNSKAFISQPHYYSKMKQHNNLQRSRHNNKINYKNERITNNAYHDNNDLSTPKVYKTLDPIIISPTNHNLKPNTQQINKNLLFTSKILSNKNTILTQTINQTQQNLKKRSKNHFIIVKPQQYFTQRNSYHRKPKQYFHIEINKNQHQKSLKNKEMDHILPQIKVNSKNRHQKQKIK